MTAELLLLLLVLILLTNYLFITISSSSMTPIIRDEALWSTNISLMQYLISLITMLVYNTYAKTLSNKKA